MPVAMMSKPKLSVPLADGDIRGDHAQRRRRPLQHKKALGVMAADVAWAKQYKKLGFNMVATGTDHGILMAGVKSILTAVAD